MLKKFSLWLQARALTRANRRAMNEEVKNFNRVMAVLPGKLGAEKMKLAIDATFCDKMAMKSLGTLFERRIHCSRSLCWSWTTDCIADPHSKRLWDRQVISSPLENDDDWWKAHPKSAKEIKRRLRYDSEKISGHRIE
jgi:hypothetical protein